MQTLYSLKNEKEVKIIRAIIEELKAGNQKERLTIRIVDHITNLEVLTKDQVFRAELAPNQAPEASFLVKADDVVEVREYCTVHGLWNASK